MKNIVARCRGTHGDLIVLVAHYETKYFREFPFVGANDNTSGTAILLELARILPRKHYAFTLQLVFFDGEEALERWTSEDSCYGSREFVRSMEENGDIKNLKGMILLDMVGDRELSISQDVNSTVWLSELMRNSAAQLGLQRYFRGKKLPVSDDHIPFLEKGIPSLDIIDFDYPYWHSQGDSLENVSSDSLGVVGSVVEEMLRELDRKLPGTTGSAHTVI